MRLTLVTETYFPQVNGVSRTLGQLVRRMTEARGQRPARPARLRPGRRGRARATAPGPLDLPAVLQGAAAAAASVRRGAPRDRPVPARSDPHRHRGDAGPEHARSCPAAQDPGRVELPHELRPVQRSLRGRLGAGARSGATCAGSTTGRGRPMCRRDRRSPRCEARGFERLVLWPRGVDSRLFRPDRPGRARGAAGAGVRARRCRGRLRRPDRRREERDLPGRLPGPRCRRTAGRAASSSSATDRPAARSSGRWDRRHGSSGIGAARTWPTTTPPPTCSRSRA